MKTTVSWIIILTACLWCSANTAAQTPDAGPIKWKDCLKQEQDWYAGGDAIRIADNVLAYQRESGGWPKNTEMASVLTEAERSFLAKQKRLVDSTIDNGATYTQMAYLARVLNNTSQDRFKTSFLKGLDYLLAAQYENGGWPQYYPKRAGYYEHITFNDDAMIGVMDLLREIARNNPPYSFVDEEHRGRCNKSVSKGIECILKCQIVVNGKRTVWCAQHDERTFQPAPARSYEKISLSGGESVGIVRFLMGIDQPSAEVVSAIQGAVSWFEEVKLVGITLLTRARKNAPLNYDEFVIADPNAEPLWARFYEIGTNRPIFSGRDGVIKYSLAEIEIERRLGYRWYVTKPAILLSWDYPEWKRKWAGATGINPAAAGDDRPYLLFTSFRGNGEDGLHLALSRDGYRWMALNQDRPYLKSTVGKGGLMRDPCIVQGPDGVFQMVWTTGWRDQTIGYASSNDLIHWTEPRAIAVMAREPAARNCWAPELFYDDLKKEWLICLPRC